MTKVKFIGGANHDALYRLAKYHVSRGVHGQKVKRLLRERNEKFDTPVDAATVAAAYETARTFVKGLAKKAAAKRAA